MVWCIVPACESMDMGMLYPTAAVSPFFLSSSSGDHEWVRRAVGRGIGARRGKRARQRGGERLRDGGGEGGRGGERSPSSPRDHDPWSNGKGRSVLHGAARCRATTTTATRTRRTTTVGRTFIRNGGSASVTNGVVSLLRAGTPDNRGAPRVTS